MLTQGKAKIVQAVRTPLGLLALIVLLCEVILGALAARAEGLDFTLLVVGMLSILVLLILAVIILSLKRYSANSPIDVPTSIYAYDVFISSILAGFKSDEQLDAHHKDMMRLVRLLEDEHHLRVYYAAKDLHNTENFGTSDISSGGFFRPKADLDAIRSSHCFVMFFPVSVVSSVLFEAGIALNFCPKSIYFVRSPEDLPFLMRQAVQKFEHVELCTYESFDDVLRIFNKHCHEILRHRKPKSTAESAT